jgi:tyrosinase
MTMISFAILANVVFSQCSPQTAETFKEWRQLTVDERNDYVRAIGCLATKGSEMLEDFTIPIPYLNDKHPRPKTRLDDFTYSRMRTANSEQSFIMNPRYLPWHRVFLRLFDKAMRECGYKGAMPYWDLSINGLNTVEIWHYFGKDNAGFIKPLGAWKASIPEDHFVQRTTLSPKCPASFSVEQIKVAMTKPNYDSLRSFLEFAQGNFLENSLGDIQYTLSRAPNDSLFYLLQRNVDRLWYLWQQSNPLLALTYNGYAANPTDKMKFYGYANPVAIEDVLNPMSGALNGLMCYRYADTTKPVRWLS